MDTHVALAHAYIAALQALDLDALAATLAPALSYQLLPTAPLGDFAKASDKAALFVIVAQMREVLRDSRLPVRLLRRSTTDRARRR